MKAQTAGILYELRDEKRSRREAALLQLLSHPDPDALDELVQFAKLAGRIGNERALAFRAIATCFVPEHLPSRRLLLEHRKDPDHFVRAAVLVGLSQLNDPRLLPVYREALTDPELLVRQTAHRLLQEATPAPGLPTTSGEQPLPDSALRSSTTPTVSIPDRQEPESPALRSSEQQQVQRLLERLGPGSPVSWEEISRQLAGLGATALGVLLAELTHPEPQARMAVVQALKLLADRRGLDALLARLRNADPRRDREVLPLLLRAIGAVLHPTDLQHLDLLREFAMRTRLGVPNDHLTRAAALDACARIPDARSAAALLSVWHDGDDLLRSAAASSLHAAIPDSAPELIPTLSEMLQHARQADELEGLLLGLSKAYTPGSSIPSGLRRRVRDLLGHESRLVREAALVFMDRFLSSTGTSPPPPDDEWLAALVERLHDPDPEVRRRALLLLADVAPLGYAPAAGPARELARSSDPALARPALRVLSRVGDMNSVETMIEVAQWGTTTLAREASTLLEQLSGPIRVERNPEGQLTAVLALRCGCGERPGWRGDALGRELLVCPGCSRSYLLTTSGAFTPVEQLPHGICRCCRRPSPLEIADGGMLRCATTGELHLRHPATGALYQLSRLPYGGCGCCRPPVPLFEVGTRVYCPITGRTHVPGPQGFQLPVQENPLTAPVAGARDATRPPSVEEVNRALLEGSLLLTQSGLPVLDD